MITNTDVIAQDNINYCNYNTNRLKTLLPIINVRVGFHRDSFTQSMRATLTSLTTTAVIRYVQSQVVHAEYIVTWARTELNNVII